MNGKKRKERNKNSPLFCALFSLIAATVCCVLAVLCVKGISVDFWERNGWWMILTVSLFFAAYYAFSVVCILKEKGVWFRLLVSGYVLLSFSLTVWFILQKTGFFSLYSNLAWREAVTSATPGRFDCLSSRLSASRQSECLSGGKDPPSSQVL